VIRQVLALTAKELRVLGHDRPALALLFLMPAFFIVVMSFALESVFEAGTAARPLALLVVDEDHGRAAARVLADLRAADGLRLVTSDAGVLLDADGAERLVRDGSYPLALVLPAGLSPEAGQSAGAAAYLVVDPATHRQLVAPVQRALEWTLQAAVLLERMPRDLREALARWSADRGDPPPPPEALDAVEEAVRERLQAVAPGSLARVRTQAPRGLEARSDPTATQQSVPAYTIFGVFFIALTLATSFVRERTDGTLVRLLVSPLSATALLLGKLVPYALVNLAQIAAMFAAGRALLGVELGDPIALLLVSLALAASATGLGLLIAAFGRTEAQVGALAVAASITLAALGGLMVPSFVMPGPMQRLALATPQAWALAGYHDVMLRGAGPRDVAEEAAVLLAFGAAFLAGAVVRLARSAIGSPPAAAAAEGAAGPASAAGSRSR
jgi:ABC-2 type transport system permease protein